MENTSPKFGLTSANKRTIARLFSVQHGYPGERVDACNDRAEDASKRKFFNPLRQAFRDLPDPDSGVLGKT
jgi:hypothetical protein